MNGAWCGRMPTSPSKAGATTASASPSNIDASGEITVTRITTLASFLAFSTTSSMPPTM